MEERKKQRGRESTSTGFNPFIKSSRRCHIIIGGLYEYHEHGMHANSIHYTFLCMLCCELPALFRHFAHACFISASQQCIIKFHLPVGACVRAAVLAPLLPLNYVTHIIRIFRMHFMRCHPGRCYAAATAMNKTHSPDDDNVAGGATVTLIVASASLPMRIGNGSL